MTNENLEDGLYQVRKGQLRKLEVEEDDSTKKIRVSLDAFGATAFVQHQMRKRLKGNKPDIGLVAAAMLLAASEMPDIEERVRQYALRVFSGQ